MQLLIERGADPNARSLNGHVPLHGVAVMPDMDQRLLDGTLKFPPEIPATVLAIVRLLLQHGADPMLPDNDGIRPLDMASAEVRREIEASGRSME